MSNDFVPLEVFLFAPNGESRPPDPELAPNAPPAPPAPSCEREAAADARRFRAGLADAVDLSLQRLLPTIAREVLGRDLELRAPDVGAIVAGTLDRFANERVLALRVHESDAERVTALDVPIVTDARLQPGDALLELHAGTIDMRLKTRLDGILAVFAR